MSEVRFFWRLWRGQAKSASASASNCQGDKRGVQRWLHGAVVLGTAWWAALALAQPPAVAAQVPPAVYPARPLRVVAPFPAGGVPDAVARLLAERLSARLGMPVDVDNRPGSAGTTAGDLVARASSDGYTLLFHQANMLAQPGPEPAPYDVARDFTPVARVAMMPLFLVIDARLPMQTAQQWMTAVKSNPASYSYGYGQLGSPAHLYAEYAARSVGSGVPLVNAKGEGAVVQEILAGRISACFCAFPGVQAHVRAGSLRIIAVTGPARTPLAPQVPTLQESGYDGYSAVIWYGLMAPARTPRPVVGRLASELDGVMAEREVKARLYAAGLTPLRDSPEAFASAIRAETVQWQVILRQAGQDEP